MEPLLLKVEVRPVELRPKVLLLVKPVPLLARAGQVVRQLVWVAKVKRVLLLKVKVEPKKLKKV